MAKEASERMKRVRQRDTGPELVVRRLLHGLGVRYRVCPKDLPGRPDIANKARRWAIYVHGCFWHGHEGCHGSRVPKTNSGFWRAKIDGNRERDARKERQLFALGFRILTVWECELADEPAVAARLESFVDEPFEEICGDDAQFLRGTERPEYEAGEAPLTLVDLFSGCGGLTLGVAEACRSLGRGLRVALSVEHDPAVFAVYRANFRPQLSSAASLVESWFDGRAGAAVSDAEAHLASKVGATDLMVAGPPCQGHSSLNNHTRGNDPRNVLYERVVRAAEVLRPRMIVVEQVPSAKRDADRVVQRSLERLRKLGYLVSEGKVRLVGIGVPQFRERHVVLASTSSRPVLADALGRAGLPVLRTLRWAIEDLEGLEDSALFDSASALSSANAARAKWLLDNDEYDLPNPLRPPCHRDKPSHRYKSMYGRLRWDEPAQTITTGFGSPGQGRYLHPSRPRTLTPHEAARIQFFPDWFDFSAARTRDLLARVIGNAVPPKLGYVLARYLLEGSAVGETASADRGGSDPHGRLPESDAGRGAGGSGGLGFGGFGRAGGGGSAGRVAVGADHRGGEAGWGAAGVSSEVVALRGAGDGGAVRREQQHLALGADERDRVESASRSRR